MRLVALPEKQRVVREGNAQEGQATQDPQQRAGLSLALCSALPARLRLSSNRSQLRRTESCCREKRQDTYPNLLITRMLEQGSLYSGDTLVIPGWPVRCRISSLFLVQMHKFFYYSKLEWYNTDRSAALDSRISIEHWLSSFFIQFGLPEAQIWLHF